ncbi:hypothetical protein Ait01nite_067610 [Actinoplanes italicus]|uniref:Excreted virulence factor EspC (Type VII ESX diderm) n=1 Tax=Actinoplanes italicus TaxID=113567 RepID=A0A2T0K187_9ACTN|nr:hypothetical protein [Actinoplanes italicus]PRX16510.1 hypothetical protein CLV67_11991 [Actinoplanes italicus]GIE33716.1 hypothetical protein Ait01nite_067610 [Actinoplanes italicus]
MLIKRYAIVVSSVIAVAALSACTPTEKKSTETAAPPAAPAASAAAPVETSLAPVGLDAATKKACTTLFAAIKDNDKKVAEAEKIGGPVGHVAVGAQYLAGAADLYAKSLDATETKVMDAAGKVGDEMTALDGAWQKNPKKKPSEAALNKSIDELKAACAG